jgi:hypothetical protein
LVARVVSSTDRLPREVTVTPLLARQMLYGMDRRGAPPVDGEGRPIFVA